MPEEPSTAEIAMKLAEALKVIKQELQAWREEGKQNAARIAALEKMLQSMSTTTTSAQEMQKELFELKQEIELLKNQLSLVEKEKGTLETLKEKISGLAARRGIPEEEVISRINQLQEKIEQLSKKRIVTEEEFNDII